MTDRAGMWAMVAKMARFSSIGALTGLVYALVTAAAVSLFTLSAVVASIVGYLAAIPVNFILQRRITFRSNGGLSSDLGKYIVVQAANLTLSAGAMAAAVDFFGLHYAVGIVAAIVMVPVVTYVVMDSWVFDRQHGR
jgi:putative flippase GtrA